MDLPNTYTDINETGCCAVPNIDAWDDKEVQFDNKLFVRMHTKSILFIPLNMGKIMTALQRVVTAHDVAPPQQDAMILGRDISPWKAEQLYHVIAPIKGFDIVALNGTFYLKSSRGRIKMQKNGMTPCSA